MGISRRSFLQYVLSSTALSLGHRLSRSRWTGFRARTEPFEAPNEHPATPTAKLESVVAVTKCPSYHYPLVKSKVHELVDLLGGLGDIIGKGSRVALKVNVCAHDDFEGAPAEECYVTHPHVAKALGQIILEEGASQLFIVEGSTSLSIDTMTAFRETGYVQVANELGANLVDLNYQHPFNGFFTVSVPGGGSVADRFRANRVLRYADVFISIAKLKCHSCAGVTLSLKNQVGCLPAALYGDGFAHPRLNSVHGINPSFRVPRVIVDVNRANPIDFALVDGISSIDTGQGPQVSGAARVFPEVLVGGLNAVATDAVATAVMGFDPAAEKPQTPFRNADNHLNQAWEAGLGTNRLEQIEVRGASLDDVVYPYAPPPARYDITLLSPPNGSDLGSAPTFEWTTVKGSVFKLQFFRQNGALLFDTWEDGHQEIYDHQWELPQERWRKAPTHVPIYWRVVGLDPAEADSARYQSETWMFCRLG